MATHDVFTTVADGDYLQDGFYNEIGTFHASATDSSVAALTTNSTSFTLKRTFTLSGLKATDFIKKIIMKNLNLTISDTTYSGQLSIEVTDGTNSYYPKNVSYIDAASETIRTIAWVTAQDHFYSTRKSSASDKTFVLECPEIIITGATTWAVKLRMKVSNALGTASLTQGFGVIFQMERANRTLGSIAQV